MLMHCQPKTKANCVKIETKLNSISATTTSRQETLTNRRGKNKEDPITSSRRSPKASRKAKCRAKHLERRGCRQRQKDGTENRIQQKPRGREAGRLSRKAPIKRSQNSERGDARVQVKKETFSSAIEAHVAACETLSTRSEETERHVIQPTKSEKQVDQVSHSGVGPRSGTASQKVSSESADQVVVNYRTGAGPATAPLQNTTQQCWSDDRQPRRCKLPQDGAGGADQTRSRTRK